VALNRIIERCTKGVLGRQLEKDSFKRGPLDQAKKRHKIVGEEGGRKKAKKIIRNLTPDPGGHRRKGREGEY